MSQSLKDQHELLHSFSKVLPYLPELFDDEVSLSIADTEKFLLNLNSKHLPLTLNEGDPIPKGGAAAEALQRGVTVRKIVDQELYGFPFISLAVPLKSETRQIIGLFCVARSIQQSNEMLELSHTVSESIQQISTTIQELSSGMERVLGANQKILADVEQARTETEATDGIIQFVKSISNHTNILGINAAIEAARAGQAGMGFKVVAEEIRKLSQSSSESIQKIDEVLRKIERSVESISTQVHDSSEFFEAQAAAFEEITASIEELSSTAQFLENLSKRNL